VLGRDVNLLLFRLSDTIKCHSWMAFGVASNGYAPKAKFLQQASRQGLRDRMIRATWLCIVPGYEQHFRGIRGLA
jgi:hypothetical protein